MSRGGQQEKEIYVRQQNKEGRTNRDGIQIHGVCGNENLYTLREKLCGAHGVMAGHGEQHSQPSTRDG